MFFFHCIEKERTSVSFRKSAKLTEEQKAKWLKVITNDFMSSEESNSDDDSVVVHPLKWRSETVNRMFDKMSRHMNEKKTSQAKRQMKPRTIGEPSKRQAPYTSDDYPKWAFQTVS